ncbi:MAG: hypothetical protein KAS23_16765, partial [Anaerohalosphaera sp.]|nr:hypothetical protein [Anaerohalosphaera sp.]
MNFSSLEFEDPLTGTERVRGYRVIEWRDADYQPASASRYEDCLRSGTGIGTVDGNVNEVWMRQAGQAISTNTTVWGSLLSIHLVGDNNDGLADVFVNGQIVAKLDMWANSPPSQTVCIMVRTTYGLHTIKVAAAGPSQIGPSYAA